MSKGSPCKHERNSHSWLGHFDKLSDFLSLLFNLRAAFAYHFSQLSSFRPKTQKVCSITVDVILEADSDKNKYTNFNPVTSPDAFHPYTHC